MKEIAEVRSAFEEVYKEDRWDGGSGPGSFTCSTFEYRAYIERFIHENNVKTVSDLGCGDWQFSRYIDWSAVSYTGLDVVPSLVERNKKIYGSENIKFELSETVDSLPGGDLLLCKEVLQHLPQNLIFSYLKAISTKYKFALITNSFAPGGNINKDIGPGGFRPLRIDLPPFSARGAIVFTYHPYNPKNYQMWKNAVFLMLGGPLEDSD